MRSFRSFTALSRSTHIRAYVTPLRSSTRPLSTTRRYGFPHQEQKEAQLDREKMNTEANEGSKTGTDAAAANNGDAAFDPDITDPQEAKDKAGEGNEHNPLDMSAANPEMSQGTAEEEGGAKKKGSEGGGGRQGGGAPGQSSESV